jgi:hypothetical protein
MDILPGFKLCRKGLHQYPADKKQCPDCKRATNKKWQDKNLQKAKKAIRNWNKRNKDKLQKYSKKSYYKHIEKNRNRARDWQRKNKAKVTANVARRGALKKQAIPPWACLETIKKIYQEALKITKITGIKHEVDHIYPLQSKYLCGLHVETNLQILTKQQNLTKGNRTWPGQLECQKE